MFITKKISYICNRKKYNIIINYKKIKAMSMKKYRCEVCGYIYDPAKGDIEGGVKPNTSWDDVAEDWLCPLCSEGKDVFVEEEE